MNCLDPHRSYRRRSFPLVVGMLFWIVLLGGASAGSTSVSFCGDRIVHDYSRPFDRMPGLRGVPASGQLPFAPPQTTFSPSTSQVVLAQKASPRYSYGFESFLNRRLRLDWRIEGRLSLVDAKGKVLRILEQKTWVLGTVSEEEFNKLTLGFKLDQGQRVYRSDLVFRKADGGLLGRFAEYVRIVKRTNNVKLGIYRDTVRPSEPVVFRVENVGTARATYGPPFTLERFDGNGWASYPAELGPWRRVLWSAHGGMAGPCQEWQIPGNTTAGKYRVRKSLVRPVGEVNATFEVVP